MKKIFLSKHFDAIKTGIVALSFILIFVYGISVIADFDYAQEMHKAHCVNTEQHYVDIKNSDCVLDYNKK